MRFFSYIFLFFFSRHVLLTYKSAACLRKDWPRANAYAMMTSLWSKPPSFVGTLENRVIFRNKVGFWNIYQIKQKKSMFCCKIEHVMVLYILEQLPKKHQCSASKFFM